MNQPGSEASESAPPNYQQTHLSDGTTEREKGGRTEKCPEASDR